MPGGYTSSTVSLQRYPAVNTSYYEDMQSSADSFYSVGEDPVVTSPKVSPLSASSTANANVAQDARLTRPRKPPVNPNRVNQYVWLEELLRMIADGSGLNSCNANGLPSSPLFVVAGACPSSLCRQMQAVLFCFVDKAVDFWWVKPSKDDPFKFERQFLNLHDKGPFKNAAGGSKKLYAPFAAAFTNAPSSPQDPVFGVDPEVGRAFIEEQGVRGETRRLYLVFVWQESWSGPLARVKFMQGRICYQVKTPSLVGGATATGSDAVDGGVAHEDSSASAADECRYYTRQYRIADGQFRIEAQEDEELLPAKRLLPPDAIQMMYDMPL